MIIAVLQFQIEIPWAESLKDKRSVVSGLKTRITQRHGAATAEVATHDSHRVGSLAAVIVGNDAKELSRRLDRIVDYINTTEGAQLVSHRRDMIHGSDLPDRPLAEGDGLDDLVRTMVESAQSDGSSTEGKGA